MRVLFLSYFTNWRGKNSRYYKGRNRGKKLTKKPVLLYLNCPFEDKDECKLLGGRWDKNEKKWYAEVNSDVAKFYKWLPKGVDFDAFKTTNIILQKSQTWNLIRSKIENLELYPIYLQRLAQNCAEFVDYGACIQIATGSDTDKSALNVLNEFKAKFNDDDVDGVEWLHSKMLYTAKKTYEHQKTPGSR